MCEVCELKDEMKRIMRRLSQAQERLTHNVNGFILAAKVMDEGQMTKSREDIHRSQDRQLDILAEAYVNLDAQFEAALRLDGDEEAPPPIH